MLSVVAMAERRSYHTSMFTYCMPPRREFIHQKALPSHVRWNLLTCYKVRKRGRKGSAILDDPLFPRGSPGPSGSQSPWRTAGKRGLTLWPWEARASRAVSLAPHQGQGKWARSETPPRHALDDRSPRPELDGVRAHLQSHGGGRLPLLALREPGYSADRRDEQSRQRQRRRRQRRRRRRRRGAAAAL